MSSLTGQIAQVDPTEVLQLLAQGQKTGVLVLEGAARRAQVYLEDGGIVGTLTQAQSMAAFLIEAGLIEEAALRSLVSDGRDAPPTPEDLRRLIQVPPQELDRALSRRSLDVLSALMAWKEGSFRFEAGSQWAIPLLHSRLDVAMVLLRAAQEHDDRIRKSSGSLQLPVVATPAPPPSEGDQIRAPGNQGSAVLSVSTSTQALATTSAESPSGGYAAVAFPGKRWRNVVLAVGLVAIALASVPFVMARLADPPAGNQRDSLDQRGQSLSMTTPLAQPGESEAAAGEGVASLQGPDNDLVEDSTAAVLVPVDEYAVDPRQGLDSQEGLSEAIEQRITALVDKRASDVEESLRSRYQREIDALRSELESVKSSEDQPRSSGLATPAEARDSLSEPTDRAPAAGSGSTPGVAGATTPVGSPDKVPDKVVPAPSSESGVARAADQARETATPAATEAAEEAEESVPASASTSRAPRLVDLPSPFYPAAARRLARRAEVTLRLKIDDQGKVQEAVVLAGVRGFGFDQSALAAASRSRWQPATLDGAATTAWTELKVVFEP